MLLSIDAGNSDITLGLWSEDHWKHIWRIPSKTDLPELYFGVRIRDHFLDAGENLEQVHTIILSSVVPRLTEKIRYTVRSLFGKECRVLGPDLYAKLPIDVLNPYEIGSDLVANALAAHTLYARTCLVVDFGTALTFTTVAGTGKVLGVAIAPGLRTAVRALSQNTARLFDVPLEMPPSALGKNTITAIQAGVLMGYEGMVRHIVTRVREELQEEVPVVATGGLVQAIPSLQPFFNDIKPHLTLDGLRLAAQYD